MSSPANLTMADIHTLQRAVGNSAVTGLLTIQRAPAGGSGDGPPTVAPPASPEALGARLGVASKGQPSRFDYIVTGINKANLSAADAVKAATSATHEIGLRMFTVTTGDGVVLCSVQVGTGKPVLIVGSNGVVVRGTADIAIASPPSLERPMVVTNVKPNASPGGATRPPRAPTKVATQTPTPTEPGSPVKPAAPEVPVLKPKVETVPPVGGAGTGATSSRLGVEASRLRTAGRFLAAEAPGLLFQVILMAIFPPKVRIHNESYSALSQKNIDPALQRALAEQAATFNKLAADDPSRSIWATVTVESTYRVAASGRNLEVYLQDLRFIGMSVSRDYLLVEGPTFQVGAGLKASKNVTYSVPIFGPAKGTSESAIRKFRKVREGLTSSSDKVRLSTMLAMYKIASADSFLKNQLIRDLRPLLKDDESTVRKVAERILSRL